MRYIKEYSTTIWGEDFKPGDLVRYTGGDHKDECFFKVHKVNHDSTLDISYSSLCLQLSRINDDGNEIFVMGWYQDTFFEHATLQQFEDWKFKRDAKKYNL
jgi:hypothetical protein